MGIYSHILEDGLEGNITELQQHLWTCCDKKKSNDIRLKVFYFILFFKSVIAECEEVSYGSLFAPGSVLKPKNFCSQQFETRCNVNTQL